MTGDLDAALIAAHAAGDLSALVRLYRRAADATADPDRAAFYLTHAHVFAMEMGHPDMDHLRARLVAQGREAPLQEPIAPRR